MGEEIQGLLNNAIEFLNNDLQPQEAISHMAITFGLQLLATLILFLLIRFKFWNVITNMIESRKKEVEESFQIRDKALQEAETARIEAEKLKADSKKTASRMIEEAKKTSQLEADEILQEAHEQIKRDTEQARMMIEKEHQEMQEGIKNEVIEVAYEMAEKMVGRQIDKKANQDIVNQTIEQLKEPR